MAAHEFGDNAPAAWPNHEDRNGQWFHGTNYDPKNGDLKTADERGEDHSGWRHWNTHLGTHFTSIHSTAKLFATREFNPVHARIAHASLHMANPLHYESENEMTDHAFRWARKNGFKDYDTHTDGKTGERSVKEYDESPEDHKWLNKDLLSRSGDAEGWLQGHPRIGELAKGFKEHIQGMGHDGITYGNEHEEPIGHTSAIAFKETPVKINHWEKINAPMDRRVAGVEGPDYEGLTFRHHVIGDEGDEDAPFGSEMLTAHHPEHGQVGKLTYMQMDHPEWTGQPPHAVHIHMLRVHPQHRRRGVATQLMKHLEGMHQDTPIDHGTRTRMGEAWGRAMYGKESKPKPGQTFRMYKPETNTYEPTHYDADWTLNGKPWNVRTKKFYRIPSKKASLSVEGELNEPHTRYDIIAHAEGQQNLYKPAGEHMYGPGLCGAHALQLQKERSTKFSDIGIHGMDGEEKPEPRWLSVGKGQCGTCTRHQNEYLSRLPGMPNARLDGPRPSPERRPPKLAPKHVPFDPGMFHGLPSTTSSTYTVRLEHGTRQEPGIHPHIKHPTNVSHVKVHVEPFDEHGNPRPWMEMDNEARQVASQMSNQGDMVTKADIIHMEAAFRPTKRVFTHTCGLDHRLFNGDGHLKPEVRTYIMSSVRDMWSGLHDWSSWAIVYFAGSEASEWTDTNLEGNNDFDVLIGVEYNRFRAANPEYIRYSNQEITDMLNAGFKHFNGPVMLTIEGKQYGPFDRTTYVNPESYDIRRIKPYAAYNVSKDEWTVKPPHLPHWSLSSLPRAVQQVLQSASNYAHLVLKLPEPERTQQGAALFDAWHSDRSRAFSEKGEGWWDIANLREKWLDQEGVWAEIVDCKHRANEGLDAAPSDWTNTPKFAAIKTATDWHEFDTNHWYRAGHQDGARGDYTAHDYITNRMNQGHKLDPEDIDYMVGHAHGTERAREIAESNHRVRKMLEQAPEYNSVEHQVNMLGHELRHEGSYGEWARDQWLRKMDRPRPDGTEWDEKTKQRFHENAQQDYDLYEGGRYPKYQPGEKFKDYEGNDGPTGWVKIEHVLPYAVHHGTQHSQSPEIVKHLREEFEGGKGVMSSLDLHYWPEGHEARLGEGNHRLEAMRQAGWSHVPVSMKIDQVRQRDHNGDDEYAPAQFPKPKHMPEGRILHPAHFFPPEAMHENSKTPVIWKHSSLTDDVRGVLTDDLLKPQYRDKVDRKPSGGHCYAASEAMYHMMGGKEAGWTPMQVQHEGDSHWFLKHKDGTIIDPTADQFDTPVPYGKAVGRGFLTKQPSSRAQTIIDRVQKSGTLVVEHRHWGGGLDSLFPSDEDGPKSSAVVPWQAAGQRKDVHTYDKELVGRSITHPHEFPIEEIDPRDLRATQPKVLRAGVKHYMENGEGTYGGSNGGDHRLGNDIPRIYHREDGQKIILTGHHRAAAALLKGEKLRAMVIHGGWGQARNAA